MFIYIYIYMYTYICIVSIRLLLDNLVRGCQCERFWAMKITITPQP